METFFTTNTAKIIIGMLLVLAGRQLIWLFVGISVFLGVLNAATSLLSGYPQYIILGLTGGCLISLALAVVFFRKASVLFFGIIGSGIFAVTLWSLAYPRESLPVTAGVFIIGAALGGVVAMSAFAWTLIFISSFCGAVIVVKNLAFSPAFSIVIFFVLTTGGVLFQSWRMLEGYSRQGRRYSIYELQQDELNRKKDTW